MNPDTNQTDTCNIASALVSQAERQGDNIAIHYPLGKRGSTVRYEAVSYSVLNELSDDYARGLIEYGIGRGIRSALMLTPGLDFFAMFFANPAKNFTKTFFHFIRRTLLDNFAHIRRDRLLLNIQLLASSEWHSK